MNVFKTIAIPASLSAKAQQIAHDLGYPERGMFVSVFSDKARAQMAAYFGVTLP